MWYSIIGMGATCFASSTDNGTVLKGYEVWEDGKQRASYLKDCEAALGREDLIYRHLGEHPQILKCLGLEEIHPGIHSLRLELAPLGNIRQFIEDHHTDPPPIHNRLQMTLDVASGIAYIHSHKVQHSDLTYCNFFLFEGFQVKISFSTSLIEGHNFKETTYEESQL